MNKLVQYFFWFYTDKGTIKAETLVIILAALIVLLFLLIRIRKSKASAVRIIKNIKRPEIIGANLSKRKSTSFETEDSKQAATSFVQQTIEKPKGWGQTTSQWKSLKNQIKQLQRELTIYKRAEEHLKFQLSEITTAHQQLLSELTKSRHDTDNLRQKLDELTITRQQPNPDNEHNQATQDFQQPDTPLAISEQIYQQSISTIATREQSQLGSAANNPANEAPVKRNDSDPGAENKQPGSSLSENTEQAESPKEHNVPLDVQELEAIAALAKRLRGRGQQQNNSPP